MSDANTKWVETVCLAMFLTKRWYFESLWFFPPCYIYWIVEAFLLLVAFSWTGTCWVFGIRACLGICNCVGLIAAPTVTFAWILYLFQRLVTTNIFDSNEMFCFISFSFSEKNLNALTLRTSGWKIMMFGFFRPKLPRICNSVFNFVWGYCTFELIAVGFSVTQGLPVRNLQETTAVTARKSLWFPQ